MNRKLRSLLALCLAAWVGLIPQALASSLDYTVAEKLQKQLEAGSGFTGTLSLSMTAVPGREAEAVTTTSPIVLDLSYIYARQDLAAGIPAERRLSLLYPSGATARAALYLSLKDSGAFIKSNLLGEDWFALRSPQDAEAAASASPAATSSPNLLSQGAEWLLNQSAVPSLLGFLATLGSQVQFAPDDALAEALAPYTTKIDLWIEGYRQSAVLGKLEDGTTTMEVKYAITPAAIKAQLKQMVLDVLADATLLPKLQALLPEEQAQAFLQPLMQSYYFAAIDQLPLADELTISRTVSLKGDTLALHLHLPFYDAQTGAVSLNYERASGEGDVPDDNVLSLESEDLTLRLEYQTYHSMTDVTVYQGTLRREPRGLTSFEVGEGQAPSSAKTLAAAFTLTHKQLGAVDPEGLETMTHDLQLSVSPLLTSQDDQGEEQPLSEAELASYFQFPALDIGLNAAFASKPAKNASTSIDVTLTLGGEDLPQEVALTLSGKTAAKWPLDAFAPESLQALSSLSEAALEELLSTVAFQAGFLFLPHFQLPQPPAAEGAASAVTDSAASAAADSAPPSQAAATPAP